MIFGYTFSNMLAEIMCIDVEREKSTKMNNFNVSRSSLIVRLIINLPVQVTNQTINI